MSTDQFSSESFKRWMRQSNTFKFICIGVLTLVLLYPVSLIGGLVTEREQARDEVVTDISSKWGDTQTVSGPVLTVPYQIRTELDGDTYSTRTVNAHFLPDELIVDGSMTSKTRYRSIYQVLLYGSTLSFRGHFTRPDFDRLDLASGRPLWDKAYLSFGISDLTGIRDAIQVQFGGSRYEFNPSVPSDEVLSSGVSVPVDLGGDSALSSAPSEDRTFDFAFDVHLNGRKTLHFAPVGKSTKVHLEADSGSPSFAGDFLPDSRTIEHDRFRADWSILDLNRQFPQQWTGSGPSIETTTFGVELLTPVDHYQKSKRSTKYGLLFIVLTFTVFFFAEVLKRHRIHPIQYLMVGAALCVFFILLLALSEHIGFNLAYLLASTGVIGLITGYSKSVLEDGAPTAIVGASLIALYTFLFSVLQLEMYALLIGSLGLFAVLAAVMFLSRNVEWYRQMSRDGEV